VPLCLFVLSLVSFVFSLVIFVTLKGRFDNFLRVPLVAGGVLYCAAMVLLFISPRALVRTGASWWGSKQRMISGTAGGVIVVISVVGLALWNGTTAANWIAAVGIIAAFIIGLVTYLDAHKG